MALFNLLNRPRDGTITLPEFYKALGFPERPSCRPDMYHLIDQDTTVLLWHGTNGAMHRHEFGGNDLGRVSQDELDLLRVKIALTTC